MSPEISIPNRAQARAVERLGDALINKESYENCPEVNLSTKEKLRLRNAVFTRYMECRRVGMEIEAGEVLVSFLGKPEERV